MGQIAGYAAVAASSTDAALGTTGAKGDTLSHLIIQPSSTSPGNVIVKDGSTVIYTFPGGASSVTSLAPIIVPGPFKSVSGGFKVTTGANVSVLAQGSFAE